MRELYQILGVSKSATARDVKKAYYALAHRYHPDKLQAAAGGGANALELAQATEHFREAVFAYEVLGDPQVRSLYNRFGMIGVHVARGTAPRSAADLGPQGERLVLLVQRLARKVQAHVRKAQQAQTAQLAALRARHRGLERGQDQNVTLAVDLQTLLQGGPWPLQVERFSACAACAGTGYAAGRRPPDCASCHGEGTLNLGLGEFRVQAPCPHCSGAGASAAPGCRACLQTGATPQSRKIRLRVPPGHGPQRRLRVAGAGLPGPYGGPCGDLWINLALAPRADNALHAQGTDLHLRLQLERAKAHEGQLLEVPMPGGAVTVQVPRGGAEDIARTVVVDQAGLHRADGSRGRLVVQLVPPD